MRTRARWSEVLAWALLGLILAGAIVWIYAEVILAPGKWNAYSFDSGGIQCLPIVDTREALLLIPVQQLEPRAHIDQVRLVGSRGLEVSGVGISTESDSSRLSGPSSLAEMRSAVTEGLDLGSIMGTPSTLAVLVAPDDSIGWKGAEGLEIITITGEPAFTQQFMYRFGLRDGNCGS